MLLRLQDQPPQPFRHLGRALENTDHGPAPHPRHHGALDLARPQRLQPVAQPAVQARQGRAQPLEGTPAGLGGHDVQSPAGEVEGQLPVARPHVGHRPSAGRHRLGHGPQASGERGRRRDHARPVPPPIPAGEAEPSPRPAPTAEAPNPGRRSRRTPVPAPARSRTVAASITQERILRSDPDPRPRPDAHAVPRPRTRRVGSRRRPLDRDRRRGYNQPVG